MNFQAVSVGQKLIESGVKGGYTDAAGTPTAKMLGEIEFVDGAIGQFVSELKKQNLFDSTTIVITAKHGQSPIDTHRFVEIPSTSPADLLSGTVQGYPTVYLPDSEINQIGPTQDDVSLLWLKPGASLSGAVGVIESAGTSAGLGQIFYGPSLQTMFGVPGVPPNGDPRVPDIIVEPNVGVIYTGSSKKQAEHGGFAHDDTNVMLLVSSPHFNSSTITTFVETTQVAPTILKILGLDPNALDAVQKEGTQVLPGLNFEE
jgi:arylsulfatase A-like enzyme